VVRTGLIASILRVTDAMDIDHRRSDYPERLYNVLKMFFPKELPYWTSLEEILGLRIRCTPEVNLQVFMREEIEDNMQTAMLRGDLESTPLDWVMHEIVVWDEETDSALPPKLASPQRKDRPALLVFSFDPHSLVMAALSRKHLAADGYEVEPLCYPDTAGSAAWLWSEVLAETEPAHYEHLIIIGDRPDPSVTSQLPAIIGHWRRHNVAVSLLNRYEANWPRLPDLLQLDVNVFLGGDWAYFWGDAISRVDVAWGRIAALCTRDPAQATLGMTGEERAVTQGLLKMVYDARSKPTTDITDWSALAEPILGQIEANNRKFFANQAAGFVEAYTTTTTPGEVDGRVLRFDQTPDAFLSLEPAPGALSYAYYWALESAIERLGRVPERGIRFNVPYSTVACHNNGETEILAINHWQDEDAVPIRLLYPADLGPPPTGNECTIRVCVPTYQAKALTQALVDACNQW
jgi:hypothetical protein